MKLTRILSLVLCLVLCLAACGEAPTPTTAPTTPPETTVPTEPPLDPVAFYTDAVAALEGSDYCITATRVRTVTVAGDTFTEDYKQTVTRSGDVIKAANTINYSALRLYADEIWADGTAYLDLNDNLFSAPMEQEDFLTRYAPIGIFTPETYASVTAEEGDAVVITFAEASAVETWLAPEGVTVVSAEGTATVTADGQLTGSTYDLTYSYGGVTVTEDWDITCGDVKAVPAAPEDAESYLAVESIDGPLLLEQAKAHLMAAETVTGNVSLLITSQAAGFGCEISRQVDYTDGMYRFDSRITQAANGETMSVELDEIYRDGKYTTAQDGGEPQEVSGVNEKVMQVYAQQQLSDPIYGADTVATCAVTDLGSVLLVECTGNEAWSDAIRALVCGTFMADPYALDNAATAVADITTDFYIALDRYTGLPTAYGYEYECTHTIANGMYILNGNTNIAYDIGSLSAYENITEEPQDADVEGPTPLLYEVTGPNGQKMWLFGTIHVGDDRTAHLPQALVDALVGSDALALECDTEGFEEKLEKDHKLAEAVAEAYYYSDESTTKDHFIDAELYEKALKLMKASGNYSYMTEYLKPELWKSAIDNFYLQQGHRLTSERGLEHRLMKIAEEHDIPLREVESVLFQIQMTDSWSQELNELMLRDQVEYNGVAVALDTHELYDLWCTGDEAALIEAVKDDTSEMTEEELALYAEYRKSISTDRNAGMLEVAKEYLESGDVVFYAVGLAHLLAEDGGLVFTLRESGYTVELVNFG